jgi:hypothetical protein
VTAILAQAPSSKRRVSFNRNQYFNSGIKPDLDAFIALFHPYAYIFKPPGGSWQSAKDPRWKLSSSEICKAISGFHYQFIGTRWGKETRHAVLDIDADSPYHNKASLRRLLETLADAGLPNAVPYQSSDSGGWHVYIFFSEPVLSRKTRNYLLKLLRVKGFTIKSGTLEVFPDPGHFDVLGQGLRLPLQRGFAWLHHSTLEITDHWEDLGPSRALARFMSDLEENIHGHDDYRNFCNYVDHLVEITTQTKVAAKTKVTGIRQAQRMPASVSPDQLDQIIQVFGTLPLNIIPERWLAGRSISQVGLTGKSQRHEAQLALSHYYFYGDPSLSIPALGYGYEDERQAVITQVLMTKHNGLSKEIDKGRLEVISDIARAAHWKPAHRRSLPEVQEIKRMAAINVQYKLANIKRSNNARASIKEAVEKMLASNQPIRVSELQRQADVSKPTLYKHQDLWRQHYEKQFLAGGLGVYSVGVAGVTSENPCLTPTENLEKPPQLLAARQIAYEIRLRLDRQQKKEAKDRRSIEKSIDQRWHKQLAANLALLSPSITTVEVPTLKLVVTLLGLLRAAAPSYEDQIFVEKHIADLNVELQSRFALPRVLAHAPP